MPDRIGELHFAFRRETRCHNVLGDIPAHVGGAPVDLGRILSGESATAVASHPAVGVDDDLASGETTVALRAADDEASRRIDKILCLWSQTGTSGSTFLITFSITNFSISE